MNPLTKGEGHRLGELETVIEGGLASFIEVGNALMEIRARKLYRPAFETFEAYCRDKWNISREFAHRTMTAAAITPNLNVAHGQQITERVVRPLSKLETPDQQREAFEIAKESSGGKPTAKHVEAAVRAVKDNIDTTRVRPLPRVDLSPQEKAEVEASSAEPNNLWLLKQVFRDHASRIWKRAGKRDRSDFIEWLKGGAE